MQDRKSLILSLIVTISIVEIQCAPLGKSFSSTYQYPQMIKVYPEYHQITGYQNAHAPYYIYNLLQVHADVATGMPTILPDKQTTITHFPPYGYYYGTPVYDFRFPINPIFPVLSPSYPGFVPGAGSPPISTQRPFVDVDNNDDDGIEKLDAKVDPETGMRKPGTTEESFDEDDTISVEAL